MSLGLAVAAVAALPATPAHADDDPGIDVESSELLDVVETTDGSVWKGVIIEQVPGVSIKLVIAGGSIHVVRQADIVKMSKVKNPKRVAPAASGGTPASQWGGGGHSGGGLPAPALHDGRRVGFELMTVFPTGDFADEVNNVGTSFAPVVRVGYEKLYGNFGVSGGGQVAFVYFLSDHDSSDAAWSLETHGYVRGALHAGKVAPYAGLSLGLDTNYNYYDGLGGGDSFTRVGIGLDLDFGVDVAVTPNAQLGIGGTFRPGVNKPAVPDDVPDEAVDDISYFGLRLGATLAF